MRRRRRYHHLGGFSEDASKAMKASPKYFVWWYSTKSILLVGVAAALAYQLGKSAAKP